ncbi:hypothetical protein [Altericroceibacterium xinjiangense]|uniref:hypothetical protein n=1 Tax=Altericroceibacterium xinjiangense TaxID=762261 RepID=UPI001F494D37|nr:hypothetical protein [Altericroceibacterium xinjiangense]
MTTGKSKPKGKANDALRSPMREGDTQFQATARAILAPDFRHGQAAAQLFKAQLGGSELAPGLGDYSDAIGRTADKAAKGDLAFASRMLAAQAMTLDNIFAEMARRMALNMGEYLGATETYARIALKAQAGSRATLEALVKLHQPREQIVKHVHVNEGGQAVVADHFHNAGGPKNAGSNEQPHATGTGAAGEGAALPCPDPIGPAVPLASGKWKAAVPDARWQRKRSAGG